MGVSFVVLLRFAGSPALSSFTVLVSGSFGFDRCWDDSFFAVFLFIIGFPCFPIKRYNVTQNITLTL